MMSYPYSALDQFSNCTILVLGDLMLDHNVFTTVSRISPEAPVPVALTQNETFELGGAGNVAKILAHLGCKPILFACAGNDSYNIVLQKACESLNVESHILTLDDRQTTVKTRIISQNQQLLRIDRETTETIPDHVTQNLMAGIDSVLQSVDAVLISDYGKGVIQQQVYSTLMERLQSFPHIPIFVDPKVPNCNLYSNAFLLTPNIFEACSCSKIPYTGIESLNSIASYFFEVLEADNVLITLGAEGMALFNSSMDAWHIPTCAKKIYDVTGAGDAVISVMALAHAAGLDLLDAARLANIAAGFIVGQVGTGKILRTDFQNCLAPQWPGECKKLNK